MDCPACKSSDAYVGLKEVECVNPNCVNFSESWTRQHIRKLSEQKESRDEKTVIYETGADGAMHPLNHRIALPGGFSGDTIIINGFVYKFGIDGKPITLVGGPGDAHQSYQTDGN